jgi:hypothetical protein
MIAKQFRGSIDKDLRWLSYPRRPGIESTRCLDGK